MSPVEKDTTTEIVILPVVGQQLPQPFLGIIGCLFRVYSNVLFGAATDYLALIFISVPERLGSCQVSHMVQCFWTDHPHDSFVDFLSKFSFFFCLSSPHFVSPCCLSFLFYFYFRGAIWKSQIGRKVRIFAWRVLLLRLVDWWGDVWKVGNWFYMKQPKIWRIQNISLALINLLESVLLWPKDRDFQSCKLRGKRAKKIY